MSRQGSLFGSLLGSSLLFAACSPTKGTEERPPVAPELQSVQFVNKSNVKLGTKPFADEAVAFVSSSEDLTAPLTSWKVRTEGKSSGGLRHARLQQFHDGVRVWASEVAVHGDSSKITSVAGNLVQSLESLDTEPTFQVDAAMAVAKADYSKQAKELVTSLQFERESSELVILPGSSQAQLVWHVVFYSEMQAGIEPRLSNYFVSAKTGEIVKYWNGIHTLSQASGPGGNAKVARTWTDALDVEPSGAQFMMDTARLKTVNMNNATSGAGTVVVGPLSPIGDAPINDAHGFSEATLNLLTDWGGYNSIDNAGFKVISRVHYGTAYENAFWDGTQMTYGDGATTFYPLSGDVDVASHEIHHGFTTFHSNLIYSNESGGMNESFSDIMGTTAEFYVEGVGADWDLGRDIFRGNTALRFMCDPRLDGRSIDNYADYVGGIDVHFSSGIMNKAFCRTARRLGSGSPTGEATVESVRKVAKAFYVANDDFWVTGSTFRQGCQGTLDATATPALAWTAAERDALRTSWSESGVYCDGLVEPLICDETLTAESGTLTSPNYPNTYPNNFRRTWCIQPTSGAAATLHFTAFNTEANFDFVLIKNANGDVLSNTSGTVAPPDATSTIIAVKFTTDGSVTRPGFSATWTAGPPNAAPTVALTAPTTGSEITGVIDVTATASDDVSVARVTFTLPDGSTVNDTAAPYATTWDSTTVADGPAYTVQAVAYDNLGVASAPSTATVAVRNAVDCIDGTFTAAGLPLAIPDNNSTGITSSLDVVGTGGVGSLALSLDIGHPYQGDLRVTLISPAGTSHILHNRSGGAADNLVLTGAAITAFAGQPAAGTWRIVAQDLAGRDIGAINSWSLRIIGACVPSTNWSVSASPNLALVDNGAACSTVTLATGGDAFGAKLDVAGTHTWRSALSGTLTHNGVTVAAFPINTFSSNTGGFGFTARTVAGFAGNAAGDWQLCIIDTDAFGDVGRLTSWSVHN